MRILPPLPATAQSASALTAGTPAIGRILPAQVVTPLAGDLYEVLAGQLTLQVRSTLPLLRGQPLQLQLQQGEPGQPARWVVLPTPDLVRNLREPATRVAPIQQHLQALLPRQQDATRLSALLQALQPELAGMPTSPLRTAAAQLLAILPDAGKLSTPTAILQMLRHSGLLHEAMPSRPDQSDLKAALQQLIATAPADLPASAPRATAAAGHVQPLRHDDISGLLPPGDAPQLLRLLAAEAGPVLARLETHQLMHLQQRDDLQQQWLFELPLRHGQAIDVWQLHMDRDARGSTPDGSAHEASWNLTLSVDFPETGALVIRLGLTGNHLHAHFHAESAATHQRIQAWLPDLQESLVRRGVPEPALTCQRGLPHRDNLPAALHSVLEASA